MIDQSNSQVALAVGEWWENDESGTDGAKLVSSLMPFYVRTPTLSVLLCADAVLCADAKKNITFYVDSVEQIRKLGNGSWGKKIIIRTPGVAAIMFRSGLV